VRLADILAKAGLITPAHLRAALGHGHASNKRLATYLVDNGILTTDQMALALARHHRVPPVLDADFLRADPALRRRVGSHQAMELQVVPLFVTSAGRVAVAMANPENSEILRKLASTLAAAVEPRVATDLAISKQLEIFCAVPRRRSTDLSLPVVTSPPASRRFAHRKTTPEVCDIRPALRTYRRKPKTVRLAPLRPGTYSPQPCAPVAMIEDSLCFTPTPLTCIPPLDARTTPPVPTRVALRRPLTPIAVPITRSDTALVVEQIRRARNKQDASDSLFKFMRTCFGAGAMFTVAGADAQGRFGFSDRMVRTELETMSFSLSLPSCLRIARSRRATFRGLPPPDGMAVQRTLWGALQCVPPKEALVSPVIVDGRVTLLLYAQGKGGGRIDDLAASRMEQVCDALGTSLLRLAE